MNKPLTMEKPGLLAVERKILNVLPNLFKRDEPVVDMGERCDLASLGFLVDPKTFSVMDWGMLV